MSSPLSSLRGLPMGELVVSLANPEEAAYSGEEKDDAGEEDFFE